MGTSAPIARVWLVLALVGASLVGAERATATPEPVDAEHCDVAAGDRPETGVQGEVPAADQLEQYLNERVEAQGSTYCLSWSTAGTSPCTPVSGRSPAATPQCSASTGSGVALAVRFR